ncbi:unnamed protein product, partial [Rotaria sp. Silwood2]
YNGGDINTAELYDPSTGLWIITGSMSYSRYHHKAIVLTNGKVLVTAGYDVGSTILNSAELYDPSTGAWTVTGSLSYARHAHTACVLSNGKVLVAGGVGISSSELYQP